MTKPTDPYSRVYWKVRSDERFAGIYTDDHHFATWVRLLIAAEAAWPEPADVPATARRASLRALEAAAIIVLLDGGLFRLHGLDAERMRRQDHATAAAAARWVLPGPVSNADGIQAHPVSMTSPNANGMPRARPELSKAEQSIATQLNGARDDLWALYGALTHTVAKKLTVIDWLDRIETTHGTEAAALALREEHARDGNPGTLLSRVSARLETAARKAENEAAERKRSERVQGEMTERRIERYRNTGRWEAEWGPEPT